MPLNWKSDPRENTAPIVVAGDFLAEQGYPDPGEARLKFVLANRIALLMEDREMSPAQVAELTGLAVSDVARIVSGSVRDCSAAQLESALGALQAA